MRRILDWLTQNHEAFSNLMSGLQSLVVTVAVVVGGIWTYYLFEELDESGRARIEFSRSQTELNRSETELAVLRRVFAHVQLTATPTRIPGDTSCYLHAVASVKNEGSRKLRLTFADSSRARLLVASVQNYQDRVRHRPLASVPVITFAASGKGVNVLPGSDLLPTESSDFPFLVRVPARGIYFLQFAIPADTIADDARPDTSNWVWVARTYAVGCGGEG